jgi:hypothetical protein
MDLLTLAAEKAEAVRAFLGDYLTRLRGAGRDQDRGASAIELAIITAVLVGLAVVILAVIYKYATTQANTIKNQTPPGLGN